MAYKVLTIVGPRHNFIKVTQFNKHLNRPDLGLSHQIIHTGQHYDDKMSKVFFRQFGLEPDHWLNTPPGSPNDQIAHIMLKLGALIQSEKPDFMMVVGDVNSTLAGALSAHKLGIPFAHVESGLRSSDMGMPEENNRILTDAITNYYFVTEKSGWDHLIAEGQSTDKMFFVGNTMIDTLVAFEKEIEAADVLDKYKINPQQYVLMTMHRPATVDHEEGLRDLLNIINYTTKFYSLVFPIHPRTLKRIQDFNMEEEFRKNDRLIITESMDYFSFQKLIKHCKLVLTDSGGIQEETTFYQVPCLTVRENTERPSTITIGTNQLMGFDTELILEKVEEAKAGNAKKGEVPPLWDGKATERIFDYIAKNLGE